MKRFAFMLFLMFVSISILAACAEDSSDGASGGEKSGGAITLYSPETPDLTKELAEKYEELYGEKVNVHYAGTNVLVNQMMAEKENPQADVWYGGGGILPFESAVDKGIITQFIPESAEDWDVVENGIKMKHEFALLGPSGCGKTTTMRCIAGFETPTAGTIKIGGKDVANLAPNERNCGMVFQSYALFPHMNVFDNVAYSLNVKELKKGNPLKRIGVYTRMINSKIVKYPKHIKDKVMDILDYVELTDHANKLPSELSGGQQQRVALARALVMEPEVLLMDEPLSNLDLKLRHTMRNTIRRIQQDLKITTIFVTHDQEEAMSMADRVAVMKDGKILQIGTPTDLYSNPNTPFIADFVGTSNILTGEIIGSKDGFTTVQIGNQRIKSATLTDKKQVDVVIRPENIRVLNGENDETGNTFEGEIQLATYLGSIVRYDVKVGENSLLVDTTYESGDSIKSKGSTIRLSVSPERVLLI